MDTIQYCVREYTLVYDKENDDNDLDSVLLHSPFSSLKMAVLAARSHPTANAITQEQVLNHVGNGIEFHVLNDFNVDGEVIDIEEYLIAQEGNAGAE